ncbi:MAG TPA: hypothetical protein PLN48_15935 [Lachnospiraceae bacterium]|nr:hypothetical protein [Lachnospiraceae bacterium]
MLMIARLKMILTTEELNRLNIREAPGSEPRIIADVHGMKCSEARRFINNIVHSTFQLIVIHGYNHGTAIKDMLATSFSNNHIADQYPDPFNRGVTHMKIA